MKRGKVYIGTSGWTYKSWADAFYPSDLPAKDQLKFTYVRFHGLAGGAAHHYMDQELRPWAKFLRTCTAQGLSAFAFFNNDANSRAPLNAQRLMAPEGLGVRQDLGQHWSTPIL